MKTILIAVSTLLRFGFDISAADANWPQFRGADARGISANASLPDRWSATENVEWKTEIPGRGWSSPIVWGTRVFLTTVVNHGESEEPKKGLYFGGNRPGLPKAEHEWKVLCLDLATGKVRWEKTVQRSQPQTAIHLKNSFASETPVTDGERVYACFGNVGIFCFDLDGREVWRHALEPHKTRFAWGTAASPVLHGDRLYYVCDNDEQSYLLALDKRTGSEAWRTPRDEKINWSTPFVWQNSQRTEIVTPGTGANRSYDLAGKLLWSLRGMSSITIATPYAADGLLYVSSGYVGDKLKALYAIKPGASGDITPPAGETSGKFLAWSNPGIAPYNPSTLVHDGRLYVLYDRGLVSCFDAKTGALHYDRERLPNGFAFTASPWAVGGKIFCLNESGLCFVLRAGDKFELLHTNQLAGEMCMSTPALVGDRLLTLGLGMPHGDIFAAIRPDVPAGTEYAAARTGGFAFAGLPDPPVIVDFSSPKDNWSKTQPALVEAAQSARLPLVLSWGPFGHVTFSSLIAKVPICDVALAFPWLEVRKNEAYPVFTRASCDQRSPWLNAPDEFDSEGQMNAFFRWKNERDTPDEFAMQLWIAHPAVKVPPPMPDTATTDITLRRLQKFKIERGKSYDWQLSRDGHALASGRLSPDAANLLTIPEAALTTQPTKLMIRISKP